MRTEVAQWLKQAEEDLTTARALLDSERFYAAAFYSQQSAEKALKALHIDRLQALPPPSHDLLFLGTAVAIPETMRTHLRRLVPDFIRSRYPDASGAVPADLYDRVIATERVRIAEEVMTWVRQQIKK